MGPCDLYKAVEIWNRCRLCHQQFPTSTWSRTNAPAPADRRVSCDNVVRFSYRVLRQACRAPCCDYMSEECIVTWSSHDALEANATSSCTNVGDNKKLSTHGLLFHSHWSIAEMHTSFRAPWASSWEQNSLIRVQGKKVLLRRPHMHQVGVVEAARLRRMECRSDACGCRHLSSEWSTFFSLQFPRKNGELENHHVSYKP